MAQCNHNISIYIYIKKTCLELHCFFQKIMFFSFSFVVQCTIFLFGSLIGEVKLNNRQVARL